MKKTLITIFLATSASQPALSQELNGFVEFALAPKFQKNRLIAAPDGSGDGQYFALGEQRLQLKYEHTSDKGELFFKIDFINDNILRNSQFNIREAYFTSTPFEWLDVKIGRQIQTWGVGDLMFINDVFPKDWISFFAGRSDEYLKAPSDAARLSIFPDLPGIQALDISFMPFSQPDINPQTEGRFASIDPLFRFMASNGVRFNPIEETSRALENFELAARLQLQSWGGFTTSIYGYKGRWSSPNSFDMDFNAGTATPFFAELQIYGVSTRGSACGGILSLEGGYYDSEEDKKGDNPFIENSSLRYLALYERPLRSSLDLGIQYYGEWIQDYSEIEGNMSAFFNDPTGTTPMDIDGLRDEFRHLITLRLTQRLNNETLRLTWFSYFSPSDQDYYFRPQISYEYSDNIRFAVTGNLFGAYSDNADENHFENGVIPNYYNTLFGQFKDDSNIDFAVRYIF